MLNHLWFFTIKPFKRISKVQILFHHHWKSCPVSELRQPYLLNGTPYRDGLCVILCIIFLAIMRYQTRKDQYLNKNNIEQNVTPTPYFSGCMNKLFPFNKKIQTQKFCTIWGLKYELVMPNTSPYNKFVFILTSEFLFFSLNFFIKQILTVLCLFRAFCVCSWLWENFWSW